jgi:argininosuccinate lyase
MASLMFEHMEVKKDILKNEKYKYLFSVEEVNKLVLQGVPFRDAYKKIGTDIEQNNFKYDTHVHHTHEGSLGNLQNESIAKMMAETVSQFNFGKVKSALKDLIQ